MGNKYHAKKTKIDGFVFDSKAESVRYLQLKILADAGEIAELQIHPVVPIYVNEQKVCNYIGDFKYLDIAENAYILEDVKGVRTAVYRLKKKLLKACYNMDIVEIEV